MDALVLFALAALGTYAIRVSMVVTGVGERIAKDGASQLALVAPAMLSAIVASSVVVDHGDVRLSTVAALVATVAAFVAVRRTGSLNAAFVAGFPAYWALSFLGLG